MFERWRKIWIFDWSSQFIHTTWAVVKLKPEKNSGLNGIRTHDLCDIGVARCRLSYQAIWEGVEGERCEWMYERSYIWTAEKDMNLCLIIAAIYTQLELLWNWSLKKFRPERDSNTWPLRYHLGAGHNMIFHIFIYIHSSPSTGILRTYKYDQYVPSTMYRETRFNCGLQTGTATDC